jgi:hypothetical protein
LELELELGARICEEEEKPVGLRVKKIRSPEVILRDWRDASGEDAWSSSLRLRERWIEEEEEDEID